MGKMSDRHTKILELLTENEKVDVNQLSQLMHVSAVTIRKDLDKLENEGLVKRMHGYATLHSKDNLDNRLAYHYDVKQKIAQRACLDIHDGESIMIESGSCCALLALELSKQKHDVTIITNSAYIADYVRKSARVKIILLGGDYQKEAQVVVGPMTLACAQNFFVDKFFIGTDGFSKETGFTGNDFMRAQTVRDMAKQAKNVIVLSESLKFNQIGLVNLLPTDEVSCVFTDSGIPNESEEYLLSQGVEVKKVEV